MNISIMGKDITFCITITPIKLMEKHTQAMCQVQLNYIVVFIKKNLKSRMNTTLIGLLLYFLKYYFTLVSHNTHLPHQHKPAIMKQVLRLH